MSSRVDHFKSFLLLAGISGAGKSTALHTLADCGYYVIDNLPLQLVPKFVQFSREAPQKFTFTAMLLDIDSKERVDQLFELIRLLGEPPALRLIFLDCCKETIVKRYSETRRPHPNFIPARDKTLEDAISRERDILQLFKERSHIVIDTSSMNVHELRREVRTFAESIQTHKAAQVRINFVSFGFKYGIPLDCDLIVDVRFLPNPYFVPGMRQKSGLDSEVSSFVLAQPGSAEFLQRYSDLLTFLVPRYADEGKAYINIGVGCTGGKHRSVTIAKELAGRVPSGPYLISVKHRDLGRE